MVCDYLSMLWLKLIRISKRGHMNLWYWHGNIKHNETVYILYEICYSMCDQACAFDATTISHSHFSDIDVYVVVHGSRLFDIFLSGYTDPIVLLMASLLLYSSKQTYIPAW